MTLLKPFGLLSLISIGILILIYILKPNFQQKFVSSTYIWKLSLKYKKKKLPVNKLKNLLLIICQVLTLLTLTLVLVKPVEILKATNENEVICVLDTSGSMRSVDEGGVTRYERAIDKITDRVKQIMENNGTVSVIVAGKTPFILVERETKENQFDVLLEIENLKEINPDTNDFDYLNYGSVSLDDACMLASEIVEDNPELQMLVFTDKSVDYVPEGVKIVSVNDPEEYNVGILSATSEIIDNFYQFSVEIGCYGTNVATTVNVSLNIYDGNVKNDVGKDYVFTEYLEINSGDVKKIIFTKNTTLNSNDTEDNVIYSIIPSEDSIYSYESIRVEIDNGGCLVYDDYFEIYDGKKQDINVLYASMQGGKGSANPFVVGILDTLKNRFKNRYNIHITEFQVGNVIPNSGYDLYIYEHEAIPQSHPTDGVVIFLDPRGNCTGSGFSITTEYTFNRPTSLDDNEVDSPLLKNLNAERIQITRLVGSSSGQSGEYEILYSIAGKPAIMYRDVDDTKTLVVLFSVHYSNLSITIDFPMLMYNVFEYFLPATLPGTSFCVGDDISVNSRSPEMTITGSSEPIILNTFPGTINVTIPGTYVFEQTTYFGKEIHERVFVNMPREESDVARVIETIDNPISDKKYDDIYRDLLFYLACGLTALIFIEWILKGKDTL